MRHFIFVKMKEKPIINDKSEVKILHRFLVQGDVILMYSLGNLY